MKREDVLKSMRDTIGHKDPIVFFEKMVDVFDLLFDRIDKLQTNSALAIQWEPKIASDMLAKQVEILRRDKGTYFNEITELKRAFAEGKVTQDYVTFCKFWQDTLGWHPFLE